MRAFPWNRRAARAAALLAFLLASLAGGACSGRKAKEAADRAAALYDQGKYEEALPLLQAALDGGRRTGAVLYQIGYCRERVAGKAEERRALWKEAKAALETEIAAEGGATLERLYYLTVIATDEQTWDRMTQYARQGVEQYEKGSDPNRLQGDDWFRLGRLHDFLDEKSAAEAAYRRALSTYAKADGPPTAYRALTLAKVADLDFEIGRYPDAAKGYAEAKTILPSSVAAGAFRHGVALLAAGRFEEAAARFAEDREEATITESQYGADLARKAQAVAPLAEADRDGTAWTGLPDPALAERTRQAAKDLRAVQTKYSMKPGDALPAEAIEPQRRFVALLREMLVRTKQIQEFCLQENIADLVRR